MLYTWCRSLVPEAATGRDFVIRETVPGAPPLDDKGKTLGESGVAGAMLIMGWVE